MPDGLAFLSGLAFSAVWHSFAADPTFPPSCRFFRANLLMPTPLAVTPLIDQTFSSFSSFPRFGLRTVARLYR